MPRTIEVGAPRNNERTSVQNRIDALVKLAFLPRYERLRQRYETLLAQSDSPRVCAGRRTMREQYIRCAGVPMELTNDFKSALESIAVTGDATVESIAHQFREIYRRNGSSSTSESSVWVDSSSSG